MSYFLSNIFKPSLVFPKHHIKNLKKAADIQYHFKWCSLPLSSIKRRFLSHIQNQIQTHTHTTIHFNTGLNLYRTLTWSSAFLPPSSSVREVHLTIFSSLNSLSYFGRGFHFEWASLGVLHKFALKVPS